MRSLGSGPRAALLALGALLAAGFAAAQEGEEADGSGRGPSPLSPEKMKGMHEKIDVDNNGKVSMSEVMKFSEGMRWFVASRDAQAIMEDMDGDKDGKLSVPELLKDMDLWGDGSEAAKSEAAARREHELAKFEAADEDKDGLLDEQELPALFYPEIHSGILEVTTKDTLRQKDADGDGRLTAQEFWEVPGTEGEDHSISEGEEFKGLDKDGNGFLDLEELKSWESGSFHTEEAMKKLFEVADKDGDLHVTAEELSEASEEIANSDAHFHLMQWAEEHGEL
eukprot:CAMPEP_0168371800 /NCGR_PEP_ID=MMETSP0228-20121227/7956_1 /TAXON_ID=133427 /ORGANISM="Protoceratium reticulatum, Strain CCCM 535 (=CCMP 1889)" /LENGTH=280 /DNA_ID=CAMNT_0008384695 /DNA_START=53 /DNA_END=895 /DNA_ORIENTATION=+